MFLFIHLKSIWYITQRYKNLKPLNFDFIRLNLHIKLEPPPSQNLYNPKKIPFPQHSNQRD